jgi:hypothetical protein
MWHSRPEGKLGTIDALGPVWPVSLGWQGVQWARKPPFFKLRIPVQVGESLGTVESSSSAATPRDWRLLFTEVGP